jgi:hypothetical protein
MRTKINELYDVTIIIAEAHKIDGVIYAGTRVFRYDLAGTPEAFIETLESNPNIIEGGEMGSEQVL